MDIREITERYAVSPQIEPADVPAIKAAGYDTVVCNRPDAEIPEALHAREVRAAVEAAGLRFVDLPATRETLEAAVAPQREAMGEKTLAYCASGTRSAMIWALGQAGARPAQEIVDAAQRAGYDLSALRPRLDAAG